MEPTQCTPIHEGFSKGIKSATISTIVWENSTWQTKQTNKQPSFIDNS